MKRRLTQAQHVWENQLSGFWNYAGQSVTCLVRAIVLGIGLVGLQLYRFCLAVDLRITFTSRSERNEDAIRRVDSVTREVVN